MSNESLQKLVTDYGSFGVSDDGAQIGADAVVTADLKLAVRYEDNLAEIERRFREMVDARN